MATRKPQSKITSEDLTLPLDEPSLLFAQRELIRTNGIDFEAWWDEFRTGFIGGKRDRDTNYKTALWTRPRYIDITPATSTSGARTIEYWPDKDKTGNSYLLSGTVSDIIRAIMDIMRASNTQTNFEAWFKQWEVGFPTFKENRNGNFLLTGKEQWSRIKSPETRPKYKEWTNLQQRADFGIRVIEYWRDRSIESSSVILTGTDLQLIQHITQLEYEGGGTTINEKPAYLTTSRKGFPKIKLYFFENIVDVEPGYRALKSELKITIMKPEWKDISNISKNDIEKIAVAVKNIFYGFVIKKGKLTCSYKNLEQGYETWTYVRTRAEGSRVMTALVSVLGHTLDRKFLRFTETDDEVGAYPIIPQTITVLGEQLKARRQRPIAETKFTHATMFLPGLTEPLGLVDSAGGTFKSSDNLG